LNQKFFGRRVETNLSSPLPPSRVFSKKRSEATARWYDAGTQGGAKRLNRQQNKKSATKVQALSLQSAHIIHTGEHMSIEIKTIEAFSVTGFQARTTNAAEQNPQTGKIGGLWQQFFGSALFAPTAGVVGVYSNYESDAMGAFDVTAGALSSTEKPANTQTVQIQAGQYLVFRGKGAMPQAVIDAWVQIWQHFGQPRTDVERVYRTDFEQYIGADEVAVHIGVRRLPAA
jgi:predicted transcriptional regulator YdeE